jgi:addiction module HigA family antidote
MLREDFMPDYGLSVASLAEALGVSRQTVNELLRERRALSPDMALRLSRLFGNSARLRLGLRSGIRFGITFGITFQRVLFVLPLWKINPAFKYQGGGVNAEPKGENSQ